MWQIFIFIYSALQVPNSAFENFLVWGLNFTETQLGYLVIANAIVGCMVGACMKLLPFLFEGDFCVVR